MFAVLGMALPVVFVVGLYERKSVPVMPLLPAGLVANRPVSGSPVLLKTCAFPHISVSPILFVEQKDGPPLYLLLVGADGRSINGEIPDFVARRIQITGEVERQGQLLILQADPSSFKLL